MTDDPQKTPDKKIEFRQVESDEKIQFRKLEELPENQNTVADKDGTPPRFKPQNIRHANAASYSPSGTVSVKGRRDVNITVTSEEIPDQEIEVNLDRSDVTLEYEKEGLNILVRIDEEKSKMGIDGGRISRLTVTKGELGKEEILAHFDNGKWVKDPENFLERQLIMEEKQEHNGIEQADIKRTHPTSKGHERDI